MNNISLSVTLYARPYSNSETSRLASGPVNPAFFSFDMLSSVLVCVFIVVMIVLMLACGHRLYLLPGSHRRGSTF